VAKFYSAEELAILDSLPEDAPLMTEEDRANAATIQADTAASASVNLGNHQANWTHRHNKGIVDTIYKVGDLVLLRLVANRTNKALAKTMEKQFAMILKVCSYSKYILRTQHGTLKDAVHGNYLEYPPAGTLTPEKLQFESIEDAINLQFDPKPITMDTLIKLCMPPLAKKKRKGKEVKGIEASGPVDTQVQQPAPIPALPAVVHMPAPAPEPASVVVLVPEPAQVPKTVPLANFPGPLSSRGRLKKPKLY
jgi:hypothetical protein